MASEDLKYIHDSYGLDVWSFYTIFLIVDVLTMNCHMEGI